MISFSLHIIGEGDEITKVASLLKLVAGWRSIMKLTPSDEVDLLHLLERIGRPLGEGEFIDKLEMKLGRMLRPKKTGPKKKAKG